MDGRIYGTWFALLAIGSGHLHAQVKSGVSPQAISLPTGPGSIEGLGPSFQPQLNTGVTTYSITIKVPPGVAGHQPKLTVSYNPGFANGALGPGWALSVPSIARQTDKGQPAYSNADTFVDSSGEELIQLDDGSYRRQNELDGLFAKIERWGDGWQLRSKNGQILRFGQYPNASEPSRQSRVTRTGSAFDDAFAWLLDESVDTSGNTIQYLYANYPDSPGTLYLSEVRYAVFGERCHRVLVDYDLRSDRAIPGTRGGLADYRAGFRQIVGRRCTAVRVYADGQPVRKYSFEYDLATDQDPAPAPAQAVGTAVSRLRKITEWDSTFTSYLPPTTFAYSAFVPSSATVHSLTGTPPWDISAASGSSTGNDLFDVNGDGLPDLLNGATVGNWRYALNQGDDSFGPAAVMTGSPSVSLASGSAQLVDLNSDARPDLVNKSGSGPLDYIYKLYNGSGQWAPQKSFLNNPPFLYSDPSIALLDLDFDKDIDVLSFSTGGEALYLQQAGQWTAFSRPWGHPDLADLPRSFRLSDSSARLTDMNGDRVIDIVTVTRNAPFLSVHYWPSMGNGRFDARAVMADVLYPFSDIAALRLMDANADGLADLIYSANGQVSIWLNRGDGSWSSQITVSAPAYNSGNTGLRQADMNANGSIDLLYNNPSGGPRYQYLELCPQSIPHQLIAIDNGIGSRTHIEYASVASFMSADRRAGRPWTLMVPFGMQVVSRFWVETGLDLDGVPGPDHIVTDITYRDGYYDLAQREFRGFAFVQKIERGDEFTGASEISSPGTLTRIAYHTGASDGIDNDGDSQVDEYTPSLGREEDPLKGIILFTESAMIDAVGSETYPYDEMDSLPDNLVFARTINTVRIKRIHAASGGALPEKPIRLDAEVRFPFVEQSRTQVVERAAAPRVELLRTFDYDPYGNLTTAIDYGETGPGSTLDDERKTVTQFEYDRVRWILDRPKHILVTDENDRWVKETFTTFDKRGLLRREQRLVSATGPAIDFAINDYDSFGNVFQIQNARGFARTVTYDSDFHVFAVSESIKVGEGKPPLVATAAYDRRFGAVTSATDYNGNTSHWHYDSFGRLVSTVLPGNSDAQPTRTYAYTIGDSVRGWSYAYDAAGRVTRTQGAPGSVVNQVSTRQREQFGGEGVIESISFTDGLGRRLATWQEDETGFVTMGATLYNSRGQARRSFLPHVAGASFLPDVTAAHADLFYDSIGRLIKTRQPPDAANIRHEERVAYLPLRRIGYDAEDNVAAGPHANTPKAMIYDGLGRLIQLIEINRIGVATGEYVTAYAYDLQDNLISITDPQGNLKTLQYDGLGRQTETHDPDSGTYVYTYDETSNVIRTLDAKGQRIAYAYDGANRLLSEDYNADGTIDVRYHYDQASADYPAMKNLAGRLASVEDPSGAEFHSFDARGNPDRNVKRIRRASGHLEDFATLMRYDAADRVWEMVYPDGEILHNLYNRRGLLSSVPGIVEQVTYNPAAQKATCRLSNGVTTTYSYDPRTRLRTLQSRTAAGDVLQDLLYKFDGASNITAIDDQRADLPAKSPRRLTQSFEVDDLYRLTRATGAGYGTLQYDYDKIGNMTSIASPDISDPAVVLGAMARGGSAGASNRGPRQPGDAPGPHALTATASGRTVTYDDLGNMLMNRDDTYQYDVRNRLTRVDASSGQILRNLYDYGDRRVLKNVEGDPSSEVVYVGPHTEIRQGQIIKFVFAAGQRVARIEGPLPPPGGQTTQQLALTPGWQQIPLNVQPFNSEPGVVLASIAGCYDLVAFKENDVYQQYRPAEPSNSLTRLQAGNAYWIHVTRDCSLLIQGQAWHPPTRSLLAGWNAIAWPGRGRHNLVELVATNAALLSFARYDGSDQRWPAYAAGQPAFLNELTSLAAGQAVFVNAGTSTTLTPPLLPLRVFFYLPDHLGSSNLVVDEAGQVVEETCFYPFGQERLRHTPTGDVYTSEYTFTDKERDPESGLFYFETRFYDPLLSTFIVADPLVIHSPAYDRLARSQFFNPYSYCANSPIVRLDPDGRDPILVGIAIGAAIGAAIGGASYAIMAGDNFTLGGFGRAVLMGAGSGAISGGIFAGIVGPAGAAGATWGTAVTAGAVSNTVSTTLMTLVTGGDLSFRALALAAAQGAVGGGVGNFLGSSGGGALGQSGSNEAAKPLSLADVNVEESPLVEMTGHRPVLLADAGDKAISGDRQPWLYFDKANNELTGFGGNDSFTGSASNNIDSSVAGDFTGGRLQPGNYMFNGYGGNSGNANSSIGELTRWGFDYPEHTEIGVHAGRADANYMPGWQHATEGCIRTTPAMMEWIHASDPRGITIGR